MMCNTCNASKGARMPEEVFSVSVVSSIEKKLRLQEQGWNHLVQSDQKRLERVS